jgi:hypothetical protein
MKNTKKAEKEPDFEEPANLEEIDNNFLFEIEDIDNTESDDMNFIPDMTEHDIVRFIMHGNER